MSLTMNKVNWAQMIGPRTSIKNRKHPHQVIIQLKDYDFKAKVMKAMKQPRIKQPNVFFSEDLKQKGIILRYLCQRRNRTSQLFNLILL